MIRPFLIGEEGGRAINLSNIGYTTVNRGGLFNYTRAAWRFRRCKFFSLPSLLFILTTPQCQRISVIYYNSRQIPRLTALAPEITFRSKFVPRSTVNLFNIKQNLKWISTAVSTLPPLSAALFIPPEQLPQNCAYLRANSAAYSNSLCPWWGWIWKRRRAGEEEGRTKEN